ncbi:MAG: hypothetical protein ACOYM3_04045 [Terrimicrobiaceae bacterium]
MRSFFCGIFLTLATVSFAVADPPESVALAAGYAQAFQCVGKSTISISYTDAARNEVIRGVHEISAHGGVLLIKMRGGASQILDLARIVKITID